MVGPVTAAAAFQHVAGNSYAPASLADFKGPSGAREDLTALALLLKGLQLMVTDSPSAQIDRIRPFYLPILERTYENPEPRA